MIRFQPLPTEAVAELLVSRGLLEDAAQAPRLARYSGGSLEQAQELTDAELWSLRSQLHARLAETAWNGVQLATQLASFVEAAGREASARRARLRQTLEFAVEFYRQLLHALSGHASSEDAELAQVVQTALTRWPADEAAAASCLDRCLEALEQLDRNAHQTTLLEGWLDDLLRTIARGA